MAATVLTHNRLGDPLAGMTKQQRIKLAAKLRGLAEIVMPATEWEAIAANYRRQADEIDPPHAHETPRPAPVKSQHPHRPA
jgi:hypothetical protein